MADKADSTTSCSRSAKKSLKRNSSDIPLSQVNPYEPVHSWFNVGMKLMTIS